jgi:hypothetical protein
MTRRKHGHLVRNKTKALMYGQYIHVEADIQEIGR